MTAVAKSASSQYNAIELTILHLPHPSLEVVKGQITDLGLEIVEIHRGSRVMHVSGEREVAVAVYGW